MAETAVEFNANQGSEGVQRTLSLTSDQWGIFGPTFRAKIPVTDLGNGEYKITKADWDATVGPIFDRMVDNIHNRDKIDGNRYRAIANGYIAMDPVQTREFHTLLQSFAAAADPTQLNSYIGTPETNAHLARLTEFVNTLNGAEGSVLVSHTQLQALATAARGAMEYANEGRMVPQSAKDFFEGYDESRDKVRYTNGLINAVS